MASFRPDSVSTSAALGHGDPFAGETTETTHYSVVDRDGQAVSVTTTLNGGFGSLVVVDGGGFFLNNEMDDFSAKPGVPNMFGLVGNEANAIAPGKRMLSSMTPTIVEDPQGRLRMVTGTPGGSTIITTVFQTILNVVDFGMDVQQAVDAPRVHHQWLPDVMRFERFAVSMDAQVGAHPPRLEGRGTGLVGPGRRHRRRLRRGPRRHRRVERRHPPRRHARPGLRRRRRPPRAECGDGVLNRRLPSVTPPSPPPGTALRTSPPSPRRLPERGRRGRGRAARRSSAGR